MSKYDYIIADIRLRSDRDIVQMGLGSFAPFAAPAGEAQADCTLHFEPSIASCESKCKLSESYLAETDADSLFYATDDGYLYTITRRCEPTKSYTLHINRQTKRITTDIEPHSNMDIAILRFGIWVMLGVVLAEHKAIAIHSSTIVSEGRGILFLGESGTGKSTHTRLWRESIEGATLLNDDSPIVRIVDDEVRVYGSPWSGKTACYKNENYPVAGFCRLSQAPHNHIKRLQPLMAIGALLPSCPPIFAHDEHLQDLICSTIGEIVGSVGVYHLECLPNSEAAELSFNTIIRG